MILLLLSHYFHPYYHHHNNYCHNYHFITMITQFPTSSLYISQSIFLAFLLSGRTYEEHNTIFQFQKGCFVQPAWARFVIRMHIQVVISVMGKWQGNPKRIFGENNKCKKISVYNLGMNHGLCLRLNYMLIIISRMKNIKFKKSTNLNQGMKKWIINNIKLGNMD